MTKDEQLKEAIIANLLYIMEGCLKRINQLKSGDCDAELLLCVNSSKTSVEKLAFTKARELL